MLCEQENLGHCVFSRLVYVKLPGGDRDCLVDAQSRVISSRVADSGAKYKDSGFVHSRNFCEVMHCISIIVIRFTFCDRHSVRLPSLGLCKVASKVTGIAWLFQCTSWFHHNLWSGAIQALQAFTLTYILHASSPAAADRVAYQRASSFALRCHVLLRSALISAATPNGQP